MHSTIVARILIVAFCTKTCHASSLLLNAASIFSIDEKPVL